MVVCAKRAFSIIELIVVILILVILIAITLPLLHAVQERARDAVSAANMRTHVQVVEMYAQDFRGYIPFLADPDATYTVLRGGGLTDTIEFFEIVETWGIPLVDRYYGFGFGSSQWDGNIEWSIFARPGPHGSLYQLCPSSFILPQYWNENTRNSGQLKPVRLSMVRYPTKKSVFLEFDDARGFPIWGGITRAAKGGWGFAFFDGSVDRPATSRFVEPCPLGEGNAHGGRFTYGVVGLHTQDGILGRDVE